VVVTNPARDSLDPSFHIIGGSIETAIP